MERQNKFRFSRKHLVIPALFAVAVLIAALEGVSAKYMKDIGNTSAVVQAKEFYFSSDLLAVGGKTYPLNPGTKSITIKLYNFDDELRYSETDISCTLAVTGGPDGNPATISSANVTLTGGKKSESSIILSNLQDGGTYTITAIGTGGYEKILSATFEINHQGKNAYKYLEMDPSGAFVLLTVWTEDVSGDVSISIPAGFIPDTTDSTLAGMQNYRTDSGKYQPVNGYKAGALGVYSSHTYRFFMEESFAQYENDKFVVKVGSVEATFRTPK